MGMAMVGSSYVFSGHFSREQTIIANQELCEKIASAANRKKMMSWFWKKRSSAKTSTSGKEKKFMVDGSRIKGLVGNKEIFNSYIDHKYQDLDLDQDGKLLMKSPGLPSWTLVLL